MITSIGPDKVVDAVHGGKDSGESWLDRSSTILRCTVTSPVETALRAITTTVEEKLKRKHEVSDVQKETVSSFIKELDQNYELGIKDIVDVEYNGYGTSFSNWTVKDVEGNYWALKIGREKNVNAAEYDPSDLKFGLFYTACLDITREELGADFIPEPLRVFFVENELDRHSRPTTVVVSPYYKTHGGDPVKLDMTEYSDKEREQLSSQWGKLKAFFSTIEEKYHLIPDLVGYNNLLVVPTENGPQIKIVDFGYISTRFPNLSFLYQSKLKAGYYGHTMDSKV
ncbi:MAG: hypothetical protein ACD_22C00130G0004 [uncultured bacterium]|uniref:Uncharacterized protein n=1 Tax=candidate division WWE3 bacterium RBG_16_37_10 TaxID=1802610 RepID=A0A1F4UUS5_UNCKA|nr:MAG: hypothetical protein ACD_22C00130G0004 [uncultured bacterium]OGC48707.1 MAG: hypothetical protein A2W32_02595 [candidate division WWE3 bacterium RBG_16_37_10]